VPTKRSPGAQQHLSVPAATIRKRTQREFGPIVDTDCCDVCGSKDNLQRHHPDYTSSGCCLLCQSCHTAEHMRDGTWGVGLRKTKDCVICGETFTPNHSKKHKACSKNCLSELGRRNAQKRWHPESAALEDSETP